jgi:hypothetical protein
MASNSDMMRQIFTLLEQNIFFGDRLSSGQFVALISPGQFVSTKLKPGSLNDQHTIWKLCNSTMAASFVWTPTMSTISQLYSEILTDKAIPHNPLTAAEKQRLAVLRATVKKLSPDYEKFRAAWEDTDIALAQAVAREADESEILRLQRARSAALRRWQVDGSKYDYEKASADAWDLVASDPEMMWKEFKDQYDQFTQDAPAGRYSVTNLIPHPSAWDSSGWTKQTLYTKDIYAHEFSRSTHFDAGMSAGWGLWSFGGSYSKDTEFKHADSKTTEIRIDFEYLVVTIDRPWLIQDVLDRRFWCWKKGVHDNLLLSDGGNVLSDPPVAPVGKMPLLPTHWFVVRNLTLTGNWTSEDETFYHEVVSASIGGGWGPFSAHGSYREETTEKTYTGKFTGASLKIDQPQIIAVAGTLLRHEPNPDLSLKWGPDADLTPPHYPLAARLAEQRRNAHAAQAEERSIRAEALRQADDVIATRKREGNADERDKEHK